MEIIGSGVKGTMFLTSGDEIYDLFKVDINHKEGPSHYLKPVYESFLHPWGVREEDVDGTMMRAMAKVSFLARQVVNVEDLWELAGEGPGDLWEGPQDLWEGPQDLREGPQDPVDGEGPRSGGSSCNLLVDGSCYNLREREREREIHMYMYIYIYVFIAGRLESKLSVVTRNCATLLGAAPRTHGQKRRHAAKVDRVVSFACRHDVVMLQEVQGNEQDIGELASRIRRHSILGSFCRGSGSGGVIIIMSEELRGRFSSCRSEEVEKRRALLVILGGGGSHPLAFCCLHVVPEWGIHLIIREFFNRVGECSPSVGDACLVLAGDLNFPGVGEGRLNVNTGRVTLTDGGISAHFDSTFAELCEFMGDRPTRRGFNNGVISVVSRIGQVFMSLLPSELLSRNAGVFVLDDLNDIDLLSDHSPVLLTLSRASKGGT